MNIAAVIAGQQGRRMQVNLGCDAQRVRHVRFASLAQRIDGGIQHVGIQREADLLHLAALRFAQHLARAAYLQIVHREIEATAELLHRLYRLQPFLCLRGKCLGFHQQIGISLMMRASDATAQLMQLSQTETVGAVHDDGVDGGYVDAGFDDGGAQQHIETLLIKIAHYLLQITLAHLPVRDANACFG